MWVRLPLPPAHGIASAHYQRHAYFGLAIFPHTPIAFHPHTGTGHRRCGRNLNSVLVSGLGRRRDKPYSHHIIHLPNGYPNSDPHTNPNDDGATFP